MHATNTFPVDRHPQYRHYPTTIRSIASGIIIEVNKKPTSIFGAVAGECLTDALLSFSRIVINFTLCFALQFFFLLFVYSCWYLFIFNSFSLFSVVVFIY